LTNTPLAFIFDLDGTLVETEELKALSYARAAAELRPDLGEEEVEGFKDFVGRSRWDVAMGLLRRFGLEEAARSRMAEFGVKTSWQAYVRVRLRSYDALLSDRNLILAHLYPHNIALLLDLRDAGYRTGLATMSHTEQAGRRAAACRGRSGWCSCASPPPRWASLPVAPPPPPPAACR
jgi:phosphoglycolate phosphatase-like HAD superfamily hydrolase